MLSHDSINSKWVLKELACVLDYDNHVIIPINLDGVQLIDSFQFRLREIQQEDAVNRLLDAIQKVANRTEQILSGEVKEDTTYAIRVAAAADEGSVCSAQRPGNLLSACEQERIHGRCSCHSGSPCDPDQPNLKGNPCAEGTA